MSSLAWRLNEVGGFFTGMPALLKYATDTSCGSEMITRTLTPRLFAALIACCTDISETYMTATSSELCALLMWSISRCLELFGDTTRRVHVRFAGIAG